MTPQEIFSDCLLIVWRKIPNQSIPTKVSKLPMIAILSAMEQYASQQSAALESENKELRKVLKELVELRDLKDTIDGIPDYVTLTYEQQTMIDDYLERNPSAWEAARKLVKQ